MAFGNHLDDGQTQAAARLKCQVANAKKADKNPVAVCGCNTGSAVFNRQQKLIAGNLQGEVNLT